MQLKRGIWIDSYLPGRPYLQVVKKPTPAQVASASPWISRLPLTACLAKLLAVSMLRLGVDQDLVHILMAFHHKAQYWTTIGDHSGAVATSQGIKRGCKVAPFLYICFTIMVLDALRSHFGEAWIQEGVAIYADDQWTAWLVRSRDELTQALQGVEAVVRILGEHGLVVNAAKSAILYHLKGKDVHKEVRKYLHKKDGQKYVQLKGP